MFINQTYFNIEIIFTSISNNLLIKYNDNLNCVFRNPLKIILIIIIIKTKAVNTNNFEDIMLPLKEISIQ